MELFADNLKRIREASGLKQLGLAEALGVSRGTVSTLDDVKSPFYACFTAFIRHLYDA